MDDFDHLQLTPKRYIVDPGRHWYWKRPHPISQFWYDIIMTGYNEHFDATLGIIVNSIANKIKGTHLS